MKLGSTRLYNAITDRNISMVKLYIMKLQEGDGSVQSFHYQKAWEEWVKAGHDIPTLDALYDYNPMHLRSTSRRRSRWAEHVSNDSFSLRERVSELFVSICSKENPDPSKLVLAKDLADFIERHELVGHANTLWVGEQLKRGAQWPFAVLAASNGLAKSTLGLHLTTEQMTEVVDWYIDHFGAFTEKKIVEEGLPSLSIMLGSEQAHLLLKLIPATGPLKKYINNDYQCKRIFENAVSGHKMYTSLKPVFPWME